MSPLDKLLAIPQLWEELPEAWQALSQADSLFRALQETIRRGIACDWLRLNDWVGQWQQEYLDYLPEPKRSSELQKWETVRRLLWCAEQAATQSSFYRTEIDRICFALADLPAFIKQDEAWSWGCIRTFLDVSIRGRSLQVPVAFWSGKDTGFLATLLLEILGSGAGQVFHHPADALIAQFDPEFAASMREAWAAAREQLAAEGVDVLSCDGRWRLLKEDQAIPEVSGRSASGAAAWGWWFTLQGKVPDEGIIILAQVVRSDRLAQADRHFELAGVDGVPAKVQAIVAAGQFDTIVVVSEKNQREAEGELRALNKLGFIQVKMPNDSKR